MKIAFYCTRRGQEHLSWADFLKCAREGGYDGVETVLSSDVRGRELILSGLKKHGLRLKAVYDGTVTSDFLQHARELEGSLRSILELKPFVISMQTGKDHFTFDQNTQLLLMSKRIAQENGVNIIHETRRGRFCFAVHIARQYLEAMPSLRIDLDISQWHTVADSYLEDQAEAVEMALSRTVHVQARMGEMRDPQQYLSIWDKVVAKHRGMGGGELGFTCDLEMKNILMNRYVK
ncbi:MAG: sugar phosphate isomerase/epimerase [Chitinophagaceae bacterium]|nr:sugar phosphate isomerase/epimerase [Chitinophagaceae bacterium]